MDIKYFSSESPKKQKLDKGLISPNQVLENSIKRANNMNNKKNELFTKIEGKLLTNDGREMLNEKK